MPFTLKTVIPWGRTFEEYVAMFNLTEADLSSSILGCCDGPAGFNARMHRTGRNVISCDPLYQFRHNEIACRIGEARAEVMQQVRENLQNFTWKTICTPADLEAVRMGAMASFLEDFQNGDAGCRYVTGALPGLPFRDQSFDLALCSHFLFLYDSLGCGFHYRSIAEMARVAREVRIYPLVTANGQQAGFYDELLKRIRAGGLSACTEPVQYDFLKNGSEMLIITGYRTRAHDKSAE